MVEIRKIFPSVTISATLFCVFLVIEVESSSNVALGGNRRFFRRNESTLRSHMMNYGRNWGNRPHKHSKNLKSRYLGQESLDFEESSKILSGNEKLQVVISGNTTILSQNRSFELGFFSSNGGLNWYLGIWYASIPIQTYVWVANRENSVKNYTSAEVRLTENGLLEVTDSDGLSVWHTENTEKATEVKLLDTGNLVLVSDKGTIVWESFDFPTDTWLPGMNITCHQWLTCWRSASDPSPGNYALRLEQSDYGEFELVFNHSEAYWSTGKWAGNAFSGVPEMTVPYIYNFSFENPFTTSASFMYTEISTENSQNPLTRFSVDSNGQLKQYTWSSQNEHWNMFWSRPDNICRVYGLCGNVGFCSGSTMKPCECLSGFHPVDDGGWKSGDFAGGCRRDEESLCDEKDVFEEIGIVNYDGTFSVSFSASRSLCEASCLKNCSCFGLNHDERSGICKNLFGSMLNLRNLTSDSTEEEVLYIRIPRGGLKKKNKWRMTVLIGGVCVLVVVFGLVIFVLLVWHKKSKRKKEEDIVFPVTNLKVFTYKELCAATRGFSEKLGHGGFGVVFHGELSDSSLVAVKRLERPGGGEKEFRAEVCTIGNIQHVNLVRLRGFCSENSHRLLVYDYMRNGPLSNFLRKDCQNLSWDVRFRVAVGTARGIAYLHEECRDCIIHCDIKPENILLDDDFTVKVSDFGMAKLIGRDFSRVLTTMRGTWGYVAPEWISGVAITAKADVYSYGMTLLEIIGGRRNVETPPSDKGKVKEGLVEEKWFFPPWAARQIIEGNIAAVVDDRLVGAYNTVEAERVALVAVWCIQDEESARPAMGTVVKMLEGTVEVTVPPPPQLIQALVSGNSFHGVEAISYQDPSTGDCSDDNNQITGISP